MFSKISTFFKKLIFLKKSHYTLNKATLIVTDPILSAKISGHRAHQFNRLFVYVAAVCAIKLVLVLILYFTSKTMPLVRVVSACIDVGICGLWFCMRICRL